MNSTTSVGMSITTVRALTEFALKEMGADAPTAATVVRVAGRLAPIVNAWPGLRGSEKQTIVLGVLREVLTSEAIKSRCEPAAHAVLLGLLDTVVPETLALAVAAARGEIDLRRPTVGCVGRLAALVCRTVAVAAPLGEEERRALGLAADLATQATADAKAPAAAAPEAASAAVPATAVPSSADVAAPTATESKEESATPATPTEAQPSA